MDVPGIEINETLNPPHTASIHKAIGEMYPDVKVKLVERDGKRFLLNMNKVLAKYCPTCGQKIDD
jgi:hypothetical protein